MNLPALPMTVADLVSEYDAKNEAIEQAIADFEQAFKALEMAATVQGTYAEPVASKPFLYADSLRKNLLKSGWKAVYNRLQIDRIASAKDKQLFERTIADPPPLTFDNAKATFGDYFERPRFHVLRGINAIRQRMSALRKEAEITPTRVGPNATFELRRTRQNAKAASDLYLAKLLAMVA